MLTIHSTARLRSGHEIPLLGFGVFKIEDPRECVRCVLDALEAGYRHIDTASIYGNEEAVGVALRQARLPRDEVFVTTKVWVDAFGRQATRRACEASLRKLGLDYLDLYLLHWPVDETMMEAWETMQILRDEGKIRSIGVSNFSVRRFTDSFLTRTEEMPAVNQVEFHPFYFQHDLLAYCRAQHIQLCGYSPLTRGRRLDEPALIELAEHYGKTPAQLLLRWQLQHGVVTLPKSVHRERIIENAALFDFEIAPEDIAALNGLNEDACVITWRPDPATWY